MGLKLITRVVGSVDKGINQCWAKVYKDNDFGGYIVRFYKQVEYMGQDADYHTDYALDAIETAKLQCSKGY